MIDFIRTKRCCRKFGSLELPKPFSIRYENFSVKLKGFTGRSEIANYIESTAVISFYTALNSRLESLRKVNDLSKEINSIRYSNPNEPPQLSTHFNMDTSDELRRKYYPVTLGESVKVSYITHKFFLKDTNARFLFARNDVVPSSPNGESNARTQKETNFEDEFFSHGLVCTVFIRRVALETDFSVYSCNILQSYYE